MCDENGIERDCAVCLQKCHHPAQLPCGHIFCFLCVKGVAIQNKNCAMCRAAIPSDYLDNPILLETSGITSEAGIEHDEFQWYYEGRNGLGVVIIMRSTNIGWWKYDERSNHTLELEYNSGATSCNLLLAGAVYKIDFESMLQTRRSDQSRRRRVRRETPAFPAKGIAGIKIIAEIETKLEHEAERSNVNNSSLDVPNNEAQSSDIQENLEESNDALNTVIQSIRSINLDNTEESNSDENQVRENS